MEAGGPAQCLVWRKVLTCLTMGGLCSGSLMLVLDCAQCAEQRKCGESRAVGPQRCCEGTGKLSCSALAGEGMLLEELIVGAIRKMGTDF